MASTTRASRSSTNGAGKSTIGHHIESWLNGFKIVDVVDDPGRLMGGPIGFQLCHGDKPTAASFRNLYVRAVTAPSK